MDANGTRHHLRFGFDDWAEPLAAPGSEAIRWDEATGTVGLDRVVEPFPTPSGARLLTREDRRGADRDRYGAWWWIARDRRRIRMVRAGRADPADWWDADWLDAEPCPAPAEEDGLFRRAAPRPRISAELRLHGLAVTTGHYLVVGTRFPAGLLVFDLHGSGPPRFRAFPEEADFRPFDFERTEDGGLWMLEAEGAAPRFWRLDRALRLAPTGLEIELAPPRPELFHPPGGAPSTRPAETFPEGWAADPGSPARAEAPRAIAGLPDGSVLILDTPASGPSTILRLLGGAPLDQARLDADLLGDDLPPPAELRGHDMAFVPGQGAPGEIEGDLVVVSEGGDQAFRLGLRAPAGESGLALVHVPDLLLLRRFGGRALVAAGERAHYDLESGGPDAARWTPLAASPRRHYRASGELRGLVFDGKAPGTLWGRIVFDGCVPSGAAVTIRSRAADDRAALDDRPWDTEPEPYRRADGPETPPRLPFGAEGAPSAASGWGAWETLPQSARGRWLELRVAFAGGGRATPRIAALRVHYPAFSYAERYLPAVFREEPVSAAFLHRFLANAEGLLTPLEDRIAAAEGLFDTRIAPEGWLDWLAGWLGATLDPDWADWRRRLFIDNAELLYRWRGTVPGLRAMLSVALDDCPDRDLLAALRAGRPPMEDRPGAAVRIVESFLLRRFGAAPLGDPEAVAAGPLVVAADASWTTAQGPEPLHRRFAEFALARRGDPAAPETLAALASDWGETPASSAAIRLPPVEPAGAAKAADWRAFLAGPIGFTYWPVRSGDAGRWRDFLARRHGAVGRLNAAWSRTGSAAFASFADVPLPAETDFPAGGGRLDDWIRFVSRALPVAASAHRFSVLVPTAPRETLEARSARVARARALVAREKPAHTLFEVRPFWALFRVGEARLGLDTALGEGARFTAITLGGTALAEGRLEPGHPWDVPDRAVIGRDLSGEFRI